MHDMEELLGDLTNTKSFPPGFTWGVATSACQIEGTMADAERGESIWDQFVPGPGPERACDHYHRFLEDIEFLQRLDVGAYRFSLAWPRILPAGRGKPNPEGLAYYDRLIDAVLDAGITPYVTLYHDDLPQSLQTRGGWINRDTAYYFADFAVTCAERFADRVTTWITINDPRRCAIEGYREGIAAPGIKDRNAGWAALHHLLLAHGEANALLREIGGTDATVGVSVGMIPVYAERSGSDHERARDLYDAALNRVVLDPLVRGSYPQELTEAIPSILTAVRPGDLDRIRGPLDFLGVNYYTCRRMYAKPGAAPLPIAVVPPDDERTLTGWEIHPRGIGEVVHRLHDEYEVKDIRITENGAAFRDKLSPSGRIYDGARVEFLEAHLTELRQAILDGAPVTGYFVWSLLDGFEGRFGYGAPFGLLSVDRKEALRRTAKESFHFYASVVDQNALP